MRPSLLFVLLLAPFLVNAAAPLANAAPPTAAPPQVVATLKPLQLIAQAVTEGVSEPRQLLSAGASPHDYQLRPSDIKALQEADLVLWVGPTMEPFLQKPLQQLKDTRVLTLLDTSVVEQDHDKHDAHDHDHGGINPHIWLSPDQGIDIARRLSDALSSLDPANAATYQANLAQFVTEVEAVDGAITARLAPLRERGYFVFHDGYSHFEEHYRLSHMGAFTLSPQHRPGARQLNEIRQQLEASRAHCVFSEPQFSPRLIDALTEGLPVRQGSLDPLGRDASSYPEFLQQLGAAFADCLSPR